MEETIKKTATFIRWCYTFFWLVPAMILLTGEMNGNWVGFYAANIRTIYVTETFIILLTASCVPLSLTLFSLVLTKKVDRVTLPIALRLYSVWSVVRLLLLALPAIAGSLCYYLMLSNKCVLCAFIALIASLFCVPSEKRLRKDLKIDR